MSPSKGKPVEVAAEMLIGKCHLDPANISIIRQTLESPEMWPGVYGRIWSAVLALQDAGKPVLPATVADVAGSTPDDLLGWASYAKQLPDTAIDEGVRLLTKAAGIADVKAIAKYAGAANGDASPDEHLDKIDEMVDAARRRHLSRADNSAAALGASFMAEMEAPIDMTRFTSTEIGQLDSWTWNWAAGEVTEIAAPYKQRKTTAMRNAVLAAASRGHGVVIAMGETNKKRFIADCVAMIANALVLSGEIKADLKKGQKLLSGVYLQRSRAWKTIAWQKSAIYRAIDIFKKLPLWIFDQEDGAMDPWQLRAKVRRLKAQHPVKMLAVDYAGLLRFPKAEKAYDQARETALWMMRTAQSLDVHVLMLAQLSEEGVGGGKNYSPKVKGGGDQPASVDQLITTSYDAGEKPSELVMSLKLARNAQQGQKETYEIDPSSGLIIKVDTKEGFVPVYILPPQILKGSIQTEIVPMTHAAASAPADDLPLIPEKVAA